MPPHMRGTVRGRGVLLRGLIRDLVQDLDLLSFYLGQELPGQKELTEALKQEGGKLRGNV